MRSRQRSITELDTGAPEGCGFFSSSRDPASPATGPVTGLMAGDADEGAARIGACDGARWPRLRRLRKKD